MLIFRLIPWYISGFLVVTFFIILSLIGLLIARRFVHAHILKKNEAVAVIILNVIGVVYAVLLGLTVLNVQDRFRDVSRAIDAEANIIADLFRDAPMLPTHGEKIRKILEEYVYSVHHDEWPAMGLGEASLKTSKTLQRLWETYYEINTVNEKEKIWYTISLEKLNDLNNARFLRIFNSQEALGPMMWTLLILGALIITCFVYLFWVDNLFLHMLMTALLAGTIAFMLFLTFILDNPFMGDQSIHPLPLERISKAFNFWEEE